MPTGALMLIVVVVGKPVVGLFATCTGPLLTDTEILCADFEMVCGLRMEELLADGQCTTNCAMAVPAGPAPLGVTAPCCSAAAAASGESERGDREKREKTCVHGRAPQPTLPLVMVLPTKTVAAFAEASLIVKVQVPPRVPEVTVNTAPGPSEVATDANAAVATPVAPDATVGVWHDVVIEMCPCIRFQTRAARFFDRSR